MQETCLHAVYHHPIASGESRIIFLPERSSICQYRPKISAINIAFLSILVFQTFDRLIFGTLNFSGTRWYMITVRDTQMVRDQKKFENHCSKAYRKPSRAFNCSRFACFLLFQTGKNRMQLNCRVKKCGVKNQNRRQKVLNRRFKFSQGDLTH